MSSLISGSDLSRQAPEPGPDNSGHNQYVAASSPESVKAMLCLPSTSPQDTSLNTDTRALKLYQTLEQMTMGLTPSTDNSYRPAPIRGPANTASREEPSHGPGAVGLINEVRGVCTKAQENLRMLNQAIHCQPGIPGRTADLIGNDLLAVGHQFITIGSVCNALEKKVDEDNRDHHRAVMAEKASHEAYHTGLHGQLTKANITIDEFQVRVRHLEQHIAKLEKNPKADVEAKVQKLNEKVINQKRRINEQQAQIESLKRKLRGESKPEKPAIIDRMDTDSPSSLGFPHSATSELPLRKRRSPPVPQPKMRSAITENDEILLNKLRSSVDGGHGFPPHPGVTRMDRVREAYSHGGLAPAAPSFGDFGHHLPSAVGPKNTAVGPPGYYGPYPPAPSYPAPPSYHHPAPSYVPAPPYGHHTGGSSHGPPVSHRTYGMSSVQPPPASVSNPRAGFSGYVPHTRPSHALVVRHDDDPTDATWRDLFQKLFDAVKGWTDGADENIDPAIVDRVTKVNDRLWQYIRSLASCYKDPQSTSDHALFLLKSKDHRAKFITRLILQYIEQEILRPKFWLGWDREQDEILRSSVLPVLDSAASLGKRRTAREQLKSVVDSIVKDPQYKTKKHAARMFHAEALKEIAGSFYPGKAQKEDTIVGLYSIVNIAVEASAQMMQSRLSFSFIWNECGVKFSHDSHVAINEHLNGYAVQYNKHMRVAIVVTPGVSYLDDTGSSIVPHSLFKANVMVMQ